MYTCTAIDNAYLPQGFGVYQDQVNGAAVLVDHNGPAKKIVSQAKCCGAFPVLLMQLYLTTSFNCAADIVSGTYPMPSRPLSIRLPVCQLFSHRIGSLSFHPLFPIFGVNVHNIAQTVVEVKFSIL